MKKESYAEMTSRAFKQYELDSAQLEKLHRALLVIIDDVDRVCRKYGIKYMLGGGSCLGAVRHKGFIPWDDDVDILMYSRDMYELADKLKLEYGDKYVLSMPLKKPGSGRMMKIFLSGTEYVEIGKENYPEEKMVFADVFPIIKMPPPEKRAATARRHKIAARMYSYGLMSKFPSPVIKQVARVDKGLKKYYNKRRARGFAARLAGLNFWLKKLRIYEADCDKGVDEGIPSGIDYLREVFPAGFFSEVIEADFEGRKYFIPASYREYLTNLYKDFMRIPPPEKRGRHYASSADTGVWGETPGVKGD